MYKEKSAMFILSRDPWFEKNGRNSLLLHMFSVLNNNLHIHIFLVFLRRPNKETIPSFVKGYYVCDPIGKKQIAFNILSKSLFLWWPLQSCLFYSSKIVHEIRDYAVKIQPNIVIFDMIRTLPFVKAFSSLCSELVMDMDDLLSERYMSTLAKADAHTNIFGTSSVSSDKKISHLSHNVLAKKIILRYEIVRLRHFEGKANKDFSQITFVSQKQVDEYNEKYSSIKACVLPLCVDFDFLAKTTNHIDNHDMCFVGNFEYAPNADSVKLICEQILPLIKTPFRMLFIGSVGPELKEKYQSSQVVFLGSVDDLRSVVGNASLFLSPIAYGSGVKTKIIEAMAMGKCVITNSVGFENIDAIPGQDLIVLDNKEKIAEKIDALFADTSEIEKIGKSAKSVAKEKYTFEKMAEVLERIVFS